MQLVPEWAPNIHPLIIHFPIVLLIIAVVAELGALIFKQADWLRKAAVSLFVLGALGAIASYFSGKQAADIVTFPPAAYPVVSKHADLALYTTIFFSLFALVRLFLFWKALDVRRWVSFLLFAIAAAGLGLVQQTAERGGMLVYKHGVGTSSAKPDSTSTSQQAEAETPRIVIADNGSWAWHGEVDLLKQFTLLQGEWDDLKVQALANEQNGVTIKVVSPEPFLLTFGPQLTNIQLGARVNLDNFSGHFSLVHHVKDRSTYGFFAIEATRVTLGQAQNGKFRSFDTGKITTHGWTMLKAVSSSGHYRGYVNDKLIVHGHGSDLPAGTTGIAFSGSGSIQISDLNVVSLENTPMMMNMQQGHAQQGKMPHEESGEKHSH